MEIRLFSSNHHRAFRGSARRRSAACVLAIALGLSGLQDFILAGQTVDRTQAPNRANEGIGKTLAQQIGGGRGDAFTPGSSLFTIERDPFRAIRRGRQLFQRKFTREQGQGSPGAARSGDINVNVAVGAGLIDSCAGCHGRPRGAAGHGGNVVTWPDSRDAPHLFGLGLREMLADEISGELRALRARAMDEARSSGAAVTRALTAKSIQYGSITVRPDGSVDTKRVQGVDADLRVRPFFHHGGTISIREFIAGALQNEMGLQAVDPDLMRASRGGRITTPSGLVLDGSMDTVEAPPTDSPGADPDGDGVAGEAPAALLDYIEFYLLNYFAPATYQQTSATRSGRTAFEQIGCAACHVPDLRIDRDRRVVDVETVYDPARGIFNSLFATATPSHGRTDDGRGLPALKRPRLGPFPVRNIFTDFKRHDLGPGFYERHYDGTLRKEHMTPALWGVGSSAPYGHDGRSINLTEVIVRHGGEAQASRDAFVRLSPEARGTLLDFLDSLVLFPPDDTASNLDPGDRNASGFPQVEHGGIALTGLFNDPTDVE